MKLSLAYIAGAFAVIVPHAFSQYLLTETDLTGAGGGATVANSLNLTLGIGSSPKTPSAFLFDGLNVQTADVGRTYTFDRVTDPCFDSFVAYLTDGLVGWVDYGITVGAVGGGSSVPEGLLFTALPPGNNGVDLGGFDIDYFTLSFDLLEFASPGSDPHGDGIWTDYSYSATFSVYGQAVPEPSSLTLVTLCSGAVILLAKVKRLTS